MATESPLIRDGSQCVAAGDLSSYQFYAVKLSAARTVNRDTTGALGIYGILQNKPTTGQAADVGIFGISKAIAGNTFSAGASLMTNATGQLITATSTNIVVAVALEAATATNQIVTVKILPSAG